jgi:trigger factor
VDKIRQASVVKYAPQTLSHEAEHVVEDMRQRLAQQGLDLATYYKLRKTDASKFLEEEAKPVARKRLERSLILDEIARKEKIEIDNTSLDTEFNSTLVDLQSRGLNFNGIRGGKQGQQRVAEALAMQSANRLLTRRTLERLKGIATGEYLVETKDAATRTEATAERVGNLGAPHTARKTGRDPASKKPKSGTKSKPKTSRTTGKK